MILLLERYYNPSPTLRRSFSLHNSSHYREHEIKLSCAKRFNLRIMPCPDKKILCMRLASGIAPLKAFRDAGVKIGIGVDGSASNDSSNMLLEVRQAKRVSYQPAGRHHTVKVAISSRKSAAVRFAKRVGRLIGKEHERKRENEYKCDVQAEDGIRGENEEVTEVLTWAQPMRARE